MTNIDVLLITPPSRLEVYQGLSNDYAAIEPPVWSSLIANYLLKRNYNVQSNIKGLEFCISLLTDSYKELTADGKLKIIVDENIE